MCDVRDTFSNIVMWDVRDTFSNRVSTNGQCTSTFTDSMIKRYVPLIRTRYSSTTTTTDVKTTITKNRTFITQTNPRYRERIELPVDYRFTVCTETEIHVQFTLTNSPHSSVLRNQIPLSRNISTHRFYYILDFITL